ncbi:MAG: histidine phosphatase family protein [Myxococcales bacterium]|nr:histidine phosphatase family protein [Myxococcales bacterium]HIK85465.1 histidine phosphatase family protein [Myxococcales bacterium]
MPRIQHLLFVRHGETVGNLEQIAHGQSESPLNERGVRQAKMTAKMLLDWERDYHRVYTSPLSRAQHTGQHIASSLGLPIDTHHDLIEGFLGDWEGVTYQELDDFGFAKHSIRDDDFSGHSGESPNQLGDRVARAVSEIRSRHPDENLILVSHGAAIAHLIARLLDTKPAFGYQYLMHNSAVTELAFTEGGDKPELSTLNFHEHLPEDLKIDPRSRDRRDRE